MFAPAFWTGKQNDGYLTFFWWGNKLKWGKQNKFSDDVGSNKYNMFLHSTCLTKILENPFSYIYMHAGSIAVILQDVR